jgi:hypothetical protein
MAYLKRDTRRRLGESSERDGNLVILSEDGGD